MYAQEVVQDVLAQFTHKNFWKRQEVENLSPMKPQEVVDPGVIKLTFSNLTVLRRR